MHRSLPVVHPAPPGARAAVWLAALFAVFSLTACEEDVVAVLQSDRAFTLYGTLDPSADTQWVHVFPIEGRLEPTPGTALDAQLTSVNLQTGAAQVWQDSLLQDALGLYSHVYWSTFRPAYGQPYRVEITGGGRTSFAEVTVPAETNAVPQTPVISTFVTLPVTLPVPVPHLLNVKATYEVMYVIGTNPDGSPIYEFEAHTIAADDRVHRSGAGWGVTLNLSDAFARISDVMVRRNILTPLILLKITLQMVVASEEWSPPGGVFDPDVMVLPEAMSNVQNGFGFVGAGYRLNHSWVPADDVVERAGFTPCCP